MGISIWQILIVVLIVVVLFGAGRIPRLMGDMAKGIKSFKAGMREDDSGDESEGGKPAGQVENRTGHASTEHRATADSKDKAQT
ncbi:MAG TPA: twin-arginine translocase TatA/TatE family subunit [Alphaproteobacteria bacterium]|nr:twin-arginine translocase TatA/TatE family subunit [Alphaproteobacteria bacterium]